ncbi:MAG: DMT family protein [Bacteroidales bacterium]|nr:DMT family protein [Bacteroidales bacterium]MDD2425665.1 DMT family protein [Bacteroidales bacterium]MDD3989567.1 DMT family protein [Bacteroidales bacterium]MDD4638168.1 DMT family protein [Bacteroidales bacterium]
MNRGLLSILLLVVSNSFMTLAWYGHLKFNLENRWSKFGLFGIILISWGIALFEYCFQVPANRIGYKEFGGPFTLMQLKVIQEVITLTVFVAFSLIFFRQESIRMNHFIAFAFLVLAVFFIFKD